ncbi:hypothetical protein JGU71_29420 [Antrihabitans sp. YC3-6]|uniref:Uncharacterized protein n=1 Tax=Antrihabitans stalagmiti TaxID=2799499 RepID=A0A934NXD3_9NOCA|nr:hypothetical protein [Antrihabitans stalagmiti]MBJ8343009.1 hypothetical protein [Antrihabitans stalagmiti]
MTQDETNPDVAPVDDMDIPDFTTTVDWFGLPDVNLQGMAEYANDAGVEMGVTLYLPWGVASGILTSVKEFFERSAAELRRRGEVTGEAELIRTTDVIARAFFDVGAERSLREDPVDSIHQGHKITRMIHLKNARCFIGSSQPILHPLLRLQLSHISAWAPGTIGD